MQVLFDTSVIVASFVTSHPKHLAALPWLQSVIQQITSLGLSGDIVYDAIALKTAHKAKADRVMTFNMRDFHRLSPDSNDYITSP